MRVDLPAPFSPTRAKTSPAETASETPPRATTPGYRLTIPRSSTIGLPILIGLSLPRHLSKLLCVLFNVTGFDRLGRNNVQLVRRNAGLISASHGNHHLH